jgi:hypothetical protein
MFLQSRQECRNRIHSNTVFPPSWGLSLCRERSTKICKLRNVCCLDVTVVTSISFCWMFDIELIDRNNDIKEHERKHDKYTCIFLEILLKIYRNWHDSQKFVSKVTKGIFVELVIKHRKPLVCGVKGYFFKWFCLFPRTVYVYDIYRSEIGLKSFRIQTLKNDET